MHSQSINKINHIHKRVLRLVYKDKLSTFENLFEKYKAVKLHVRNLKVKPKIICHIFKLSSPIYNLRNKIDIVSNQVKTVQFESQISEKNAFHKNALVKSARYKFILLALYNRTEVTLPLCNYLLFYLF